MSRPKVWGTLRKHMNILYKHFSSLYNRLRLIANRYRGIYKIQQNDPASTKIPKYFSGLEKTSYATRTDNFETESKSQTMPTNWIVYLTQSVTQPCTSFPSTYGTWTNIDNKTKSVTDTGSTTNPVLYANTSGNIMQVYGNFYKDEEFVFYAKFSKNGTPATFTYEIPYDRPYNCNREQNGRDGETVTVDTVVGMSCKVDGVEVAGTTTESSGYVKYHFSLKTGYHTIVWSLYTNYGVTYRGNSMIYPKVWINFMSYKYITGTSRTPTSPTSWWVVGAPNSEIKPPYLVQTFDEDLRRPYAGGENDNSGRTPVIEHQEGDQYGSINMPPKVWDGKEGWEANQSTRFAIKEEDIKRMIEHTIVLSQIVEPLDTKNQLPSLQTIKRDLDLTIEKGTTISKGSVESIEKIVDKILKVLDGYDSYYNDSDVCKVQCQISCQTGCLVACQSCNNGQCHDQKCGAH